MALPAASLPAAFRIGPAKFNYTYLRQHDDEVWACVRGPDERDLERNLLFIIRADEDQDKGFQWIAGYCRDHSGVAESENLVRVWGSPDNIFDDFRHMKNWAAWDIKMERWPTTDDPKFQWMDFHTTVIDAPTNGRQEV